MIYLVYLLVLANSYVALQDGDDDRLKSEVKHFRMYRGFVAKVEASYASEFIDLRGEQRNELYEIQERYKPKAKSIVDQTGLNLTEKYEQLVKLREKQDDELKNVLLPEQLNRLKFFSQYIKIHRQGFAYSLAKFLNLSDSERVEVNKAAIKSSEVYREQEIKAQKQAISSIRKSLSVAKRRKFDELLEPLFAGDRTFWDVDISMLKPSLKVFGAYRLP